MDGPPATPFLWHRFIRPCPAKRNDGKRNRPEFCDFTVRSFKIIGCSEKVGVVVTNAEMQV
jgi:hypothetical protein